MMFPNNTPGLPKVERWKGSMTDLSPIWNSIKQDDLLKKSIEVKKKRKPGKLTP